MTPSGTVKWALRTLGLQAANERGGEKIKGLIGERGRKE